MDRGIQAANSPGLLAHSAKWRTCFVSLYSDVRLNMHLIAELPTEVLEALNYLVYKRPLPSLPEHPLFKERRHDHLLNNGQLHELVHEVESNRYLLNVFSSHINYASEAFQLFLNWIGPYVSPLQNSEILGWICDEENHGKIVALVDGKPTCVAHVLHEKENVRIFTGITEGNGVIQLRVHAGGETNLIRLDGQEFSPALGTGLKAIVEELLDELPDFMVKFVDHDCQQPDRNQRTKIANYAYLPACCRKARRLVRPN